MNEEELIKKMAKEWDKNGGSTKFWEIKAELRGFQKGKLEQKKEDIKLINNLKNPYPRDVFTEPSKEQWDKLQILFEDNNLTQDRYFGSFGRLVFNNIIKQLQKEINSQTEQNSDKEVAQPYSKSDKTTKEIGGMK